MTRIDDVTALALQIAQSLKEAASETSDVEQKLSCYEHRADLIKAARENDFMAKNFQGIKRSRA